VTAVERVIFAAAFGFWAAYGLYLLASFVKGVIMPRTYGPDTVPEVPSIPFSLNVIRESDDGARQIETHHFTARPDPSAGDFTRFAMAQSSENGGDLLLVLRDVMARMIANDDGVPLQWEYHELPPGVKAPTAEVAVTGTFEDSLAAPVEPNFRGPDGQIYPASERKRFEEFDAGSSRRRLHHLMFESTTAKVHVDTVTEIMKDLFGSAAGRPTIAR
jgi:hypothetical protein